ncbi:hypothetical protein [Paenarthrobacter nitroguajacolicus]
MTLGLIFMGIGLVWLPFRKWIARLQYIAASQMLGRKVDFSESKPHHEAGTTTDEERIRGFEMLGVFFCSVLIVGGLLIVVLSLIFRPPWAGA